MKLGWLCCAAVWLSGSLHCKNQPNQLLGSMGECDIVMFALRSLLGKIGREDWIPKADMKYGSKGEKAYLSATNINYPVMQSVNSLRLDDYLCFICSAYCLSARSGTRTLRLMICSLGQKKWSRGSRQCECWEPRLFCIGGLLSGYSLGIAGVRVQVYSDADEKTLCALVE